MKKTICLLLSLSLVLALCACGNTTGGKNVEGTLQEIFAKIYENAGVESPMLMETVLDDTNKAGFLGTDEVAFTEGLSSDAAIMTIPHAMVLIRVDSNADIEAVKTKIRENADPRKWICVGVEEDEVIVDSIGDLVFFVMSADAKAYHNSFKLLAK